MVEPRHGVNKCVRAVFSATAKVDNNDIRQVLNYKQHE